MLYAPRRTTFLVLTTLFLAFSLVAADCGFDDLSEAVWAREGQKVLQWATDRFNDWNANHRNDYDGPYDWLFHTYAPNQTATSYDCLDPNGRCHLYSCHDLADNLEGEDKKMALYTLQHVSNIANWYTALFRAMKEAASRIQDRKERLVTTFSDMVPYNTYQRDQRTQKARALHTGLTIILITSAALGPIPVVGQVANSLAGAYAGLTALELDEEVPHQSRYVWEEFLSEVFLEASSVMEELRMNATSELLRGGRDIYGNTMLDLMKSGKFSKYHMKVEKSIIDQLDQVYTEIAIALLWGQDQTYIVKADALNGCQNDHRGPEQVRVCLDDDPCHSYWAYYFGREVEGDIHGLGETKHIRLRGPPGYLSLANDRRSWKNASLDNIVRYSVDYYHKWGNSVVDMTGQEHLEWLSARKGNQGYQGFGDLPVCYSPNGGAISSIMHKKARNYPCMCGNDMGKGGRQYNPATDETEAFLQKTGLFMSKDFQQYCKEDEGKDMDCKMDKSRMFDFHAEDMTMQNLLDLNVVRTQHPFKKCSGHPNHKHKGYECPGANGVTNGAKNNKQCLVDVDHQAGLF